MDKQPNKGSERDVGGVNLALGLLCLGFLWGWSTCLVIVLIFFN